MTDGLAISSKMHANARSVTREILAKFPQVKQIWTYATFPDHNNCRCTDYMITISGMSRDKQIALGDAIANYAIKNAARIGLNWLIWNRRIYRFQNTDRGHGWAEYTGPKPHTDHVHIEVTDKVYQPPKDEDWTMSITADELAKAIVKEAIAQMPAIISAVAKADVWPVGVTEPDSTNLNWTLGTYVKRDHAETHQIAVNTTPK